MLSINIILIYYTKNIQKHVKKDPRFLKHMYTLENDTWCESSITLSIYHTRIIAWLNKVHWL